MEENKEVIQPEVTEQVEVKSTKKSVFDNKKNIIITALAAVIVLVGLFLGYTKLFSPKNIFKKAMDKGYSRVEKFFDDAKGSKKPLMTTEDVTFKISMNESMVDEETKDMIKKFNQLKMTSVSKVDPKNNRAQALINILNGDKELLAMDAYVMDQKIYVKIKDTLDKYIEIPFEINSSSKDLTEDEVKYLLSKTKDMLVKNMSDKDFTVKTEKIRIDKKDVKVKKVLYNISEKSTSELMVKFLKDAKKDSKYIKIVAKADGKSEKEIKTSIDESIKNVEKKIKSGKLSTKVEERIGVLVKGLLRNYSGIIFESDEVKLVYYTSKSKKAFVAKAGKEEVINAYIIKDKYYLEAGEGKEKLVLDGTKKEKGKTTTYDFTLSAGVTALDGKLTINKLKENKDRTGKTETKLSISMMGLVTIDIKDITETKKIKGVEEKEIKNSVKYEDLSMEDMEKIMVKISNLFEF